LKILANFEKFDQGLNLLKLVFYIVLLRMAKRKNLDIMQKIAYIGDRKHSFRIVKTLFLHKTYVLVILVPFLAYSAPKPAKLYNCTNM